jgi:hypothetical protein
MKTFLVMLSVCICVAGCSSISSSDKQNGLKIVSRAEWGANPPVAEMRQHEITRITIHHTATRQKPERSLAEKMQALQKFSQNPGTLGNGKPKPSWPDVPYHFYVDCHGDIAEGREVRFVGDTNTSYDPTGHLLVVLEGNFEEEQPTGKQIETLNRFIRLMAGRHRIAPGNFGSHKEFAETLCPGKNLQTLMDDIRKRGAMSPDKR